MRLLIVEDNEVLAGLISEKLRDAGYHSERAPTSHDARLMLKVQDYAAILLDLGLPGEDGLTLLSALRNQGNTTPVLILTARASIQDRVTGLNRGADDYLPKPFAAEELIARVASLLRRSVGEPSGKIVCGALSFDLQAHVVQVNGQTLLLSQRETQVLELLMRHRDKVVRKSQIEAEFFGLGTEFSSNSVEVGVYRLRKRLEAIDSQVEIVTLRGLGYLLRACEPA